MAWFWVKNSTDIDGLRLKHQMTRRFRCEDNDVRVKHVGPHYYFMRQLEACHQLGQVAMRSSSAIELSTAPTSADVLLNRPPLILSGLLI